ncbi:MAG TPA: SBBP repeat-containing protein [Bacteroidia bacterium]
MKTKLLLFIALFSLQLKAQTVDAVYTAGGTLADFSRVIALTPTGNIAVAGNAGSSFTWGSNALTNAGQNDIIIAQYDNTGNVLWAKMAGGTGMDAANSVAVDANGNVFISGSFQNTFSWGSNNMVSNGSDDLYFAKYDAGGNLLFVKQYGGTGSDRANAITLDNAGNVYIAGYFSANFTFGSTPLTTAGSNDVLVAKFDNAGNLQWVKTAGGTGVETGREIIADASGNIYVGGTYGSAFTYGSTTLTYSAMNDIFMAKYDGMNGNVLWASGAGGTLNDQPMGIARSAAGNILLCGYFQSNFTYGPTTFTNAGAEDIFVAEYAASNGTINFAKQAGGTGSDEGLWLQTDAAGNIYVTGYFNGSWTYGSTLITSAGSDDELISKYDATGNVLGVVTHGGTGLDRGRGVTLDANNNIYVVGEFQNSFSYGTFPITSAGADDIYLSILCQQPPPTPVITQNANTLSTTANGTYQWYLNGNALNGATNSSYTTGSTGNYWVVVSNACGQSQPSNSIYVAFSAANEMNSELNFAVFPVPSNGNFTFQCNMINEANATLRISDLVGNTVFTEVRSLQKGNNTAAISGSDLAPGVYFISIETAQGKCTRQLIIEK